MTEEMKKFIKAIETIPDGRLHTMPDGKISLWNADTQVVLYGPDLTWCNPACETLFLARVERALALRGWDWT